MKIDTVVFDIGGVLVGFPGVRFFEGKGLDREMSNRLIGATFASGHWHELDLGILSKEEIFRLFAAKDPEISDVVHDVLRDMGGIIFRLEQTIPWIRRIKKSGRRVLYLSNLSAPVLQSNPDALDFLPETDGGILSFREHMIKPDPLIYRLLCERYHVDSGHAVFVDDIEVNRRAAREIGFHTVGVEAVYFKDADRIQRESIDILDKFLKERG